MRKSSKYTLIYELRRLWIGLCLTVSLALGAPAFAANGIPFTSSFVAWTSATSIFGTGAYASGLTQFNGFRAETTCPQPVVVYFYNSAAPVLGTTTPIYIAVLQPTGKMGGSDSEDFGYSQAAGPALTNLSFIMTAVASCSGYSAATSVY